MSYSFKLYRPIVSCMSVDLGIPYNRTVKMAIGTSRALAVILGSDSSADQICSLLSDSKVFKVIFIAIHAPSGLLILLNTSPVSYKPG